MTRAVSLAWLAGWLNAWLPDCVVRVWNRFSTNPSRFDVIIIIIIYFQFRPPDKQVLRNESPATDISWYSNALITGDGLFIGFLISERWYEVREKWPVCLSGGDCG